VILGLALLLVGYIGVFFGKMIKAAVSRQREYLADSAAVQFTRNPEGLAGALKKIGAQAQGSRVRDHHAEELSHLFFANGMRRSFFGFLNTHPPLDERIRRLDPAFSGDFAEVERGERPSEPVPAREHAAAAARHGFPVVAAAGMAALAQQGAAAAAVGSIGAPTPEHLKYASALLERLPEPVTRAAHDPEGAQALVMALVLADTEGPLTGTVEAVRDYGGERMTEWVNALLPHVREAGTDAALPLLDVALPALQRMPPEQGVRYREAVERLVHADETVRMFEYALLHTLARRLQTTEGEVDRTGRTIRSLEPLRDDVRVILSAVAWAGAGDDVAAAQAAFEAGVRRLPSAAGRLTLEDPRGAALERIDRALTALEHAAPPVQRVFLEACADAATHDRRLDRAEAELLRAIAESLDCPMPPLLGLAA
jgi:hypothetical protein